MAKKLSKKQLNTKSKLKAYQAAYKVAHNISLAANEIIGRRTRTSKTFQLPDGRFQTIVHGKSLHYEELEGSGEWLDITLNVEPSGRAGYDWQVADNRFQYFFKNDHSRPYPILASFKGHDLYQKIAAVCHYDPTTDKITILQRALPAILVVDGHHLHYSGIFTGVDLEYVVDTDFCHGFLHISIAGKTALSNAIQQKQLNPDGWVFFATKLDLDNYDLNPDVIIGDEYTRPIHWKDVANKILHWFVPDVAQDERPGPEGTQPCCLKLYKHPSLGWLLSTALPLNWLKDSVGVVVIDPPTNYYGETADGWINGEATSYATARATSKSCGDTGVGGSIGQQFIASWYYVHRGFLSFDTSGIPDTALVTSAFLYVRAGSDYSTTDFLIQVYRYAWAEGLCANGESNYDGAYGGSALLEGTLRDTAAGWTYAAYHNMAVAPEGINKTGDTKYTLVSNRDVDNTAPTGSEYVEFRTANYAGSEPYLAITYTENQAPTAPTSLLCEGATNPLDVTDTTPELSAIYNDPDAGDIANKYRIQVDDDPAFDTPIWDSGAAGTAMANVTAGQRCADISYAGSALTVAITYYWRIKFWDDDGAEGAWSTEEAYFALIESFVADAVLKGTLSSSFTANAVLKETQSDSLTADAYLSPPIYSLTADAVLKGTLPSSIVADAILQKIQSGSLTADAYLATIYSLYADAILKGTQSDSLAVDAYLTRTVSDTLTADACLIRTVSDTLIADATLKGTRSASVIADAILKKTQSSIFTVDSLLIQTVSDTLTADAVLKETQPDSFTAGAYLVGQAVSPKQHLFTKAGPIYLPVFPLQPVTVLVTTNHTADYRSVILCDASSGSLVVTLPDATDNLNKTYTIKHTSGSHAVVIQGTDTIDGAASQTLDEYDVLRIISDNTEWWII